MSRRGGLALALLLVAAVPAASQVTVWANGVYDLAAPAWTETRTFTVFLEDARYDARLEADAAAGFDVGIQVSLYAGVGPTLALSKVSRDATGTLDASIPHPFFFDRDRTASLELLGYGYEEQVLHAGVGWQGESGALGFAVFGGVSLFQVKADAVEAVEFDQSFPFDEVTLRSPLPVQKSDEPSGFHLGGRLDWKVSRSVGLGAQLRFSAATARFTLATGESFEVDAGGLQLAAGLRIYF